MGFQRLWPGDDAPPPTAAMRSPLKSGDSLSALVFWAHAQHDSIDRCELLFGVETGEHRVERLHERCGRFFEPVARRAAVEPAEPGDDDAPVTAFFLII